MGAYDKISDHEMCDKCNRPEQSCICTAKETIDRPMTSSYIKTSVECCWPNPQDPNDIEWMLRFGKVDKSHLLVAASYINAYRSLFDLTQKELIQTVSAIKKKLRKE